MIRIAHAEELSAARCWPVFALGLFAGAVGKSAQFPLHVWLPDAMEGPTPVSALIHAATMVAAGVYLVARMLPDRSRRRRRGADGRSPTSAASPRSSRRPMGIVATDIKRVLAYSTISQLGYMMLALGVGGYVAAIFHLFTHAFFKALLFLGAGSREPRDRHIRHAGDGRPAQARCRSRSATFLIGSLSLAGVVPAGGLLEQGRDPPRRVARRTAASSRSAMHGRVHDRVLHVPRDLPDLLRRVQGGAPSEHGSDHEDDAHHSGPHESPLPMWAPLAILAVPAIVIGLGEPRRWLRRTCIEGALP